MDSRTIQEITDLTKSLESLNSARFTYFKECDKLVAISQIDNNDAEFLKTALFPQDKIKKQESSLCQDLNKAIKPVLDKWVDIYKEILSDLLKK